MSKKTIVWLTLAMLLLVIGGSVFAVAMTILEWDFTKLSTERYETNTYEIEEDFTDISMITDTAKILFVPAEDGKCRVVCYEEEHAKHFAEVRDGALTVNVFHKKAGYNFVGIFFESPKLTVYLPKSVYATLSIQSDSGDIEIPRDFAFQSLDITTDTGDVKLLSSVSDAISIRADTGDVCLESLEAGSVEIKTTTGDIMLSLVTCTGNVDLSVSSGDVAFANGSCQTLVSEGNTGDLNLQGVMVIGRLAIERSTGDVTLERCDAAEIQIQTDTGDVSGTLLSEKVFLVETDTGDIDVPKRMSGGTCEVTTDTGDIAFSYAIDKS